MNKGRKEIMEKLLSQNTGFLTIRSYMGPIHERIVYPKKNANNTWFLGVEPITEKMRNSGDVYVDPLNVDNPLASCELRDGVVFDLSNDEDKLILNWLLYLDNRIAINYEEKKDDNSTTFYIENEALETKAKMSKFETKDSATQILKALPPEEVIKIARLLGMGASGNAESVRLAIRESFERVKGDKFIDKFLDVTHDKNREIKLVAMQLVDKGIIIHNKIRNEYTYGIGGDFLGKSFEQYYTRLQDSDMQGMFLQMLQEGGLTYHSQKSTSKASTKTPVKPTPRKTPVKKQIAK